MTDWRSAAVRLYLDFTGILDIVDKVKGLFKGLSEGNHAVVPQHQHLEHTHGSSSSVSPHS